MTNARDAYRRGNEFFNRAKTIERSIQFDDHGYISNPTAYWDSEQLYNKAMVAYIKVLDLVGDRRLRELSCIEGPFDPELFKREMHYLDYAASRRACEHMKIYIESEHSEQIEDLCDRVLRPKPEDFFARLESAKPRGK